MLALFLPLLLAAAPAPAQAHSHRQVETKARTVWTADPLPPPMLGEAGVLVPVAALLAALGARDGAAVLAQVRPDGSATVADEGDGNEHALHRLSWPEFAAGLRPGPERFTEWAGDYATEMDGDIAFVWAPYRLLVGDQVRECGYHLFDVVRESGKWRVLNLTWSKHVKGCNAP